MNNLEVRHAMKLNRVFSYEVAEALGIADTTMSRKMRKELDTEEKEKVLAIIEKLARREM